MPRIVDKGKVKEEILDAFEECIQEKPVSSISLRDIAKKADMSHPKLLNYFSTKDDIVAAYFEHTKLDMVRFFEKWFDEHCVGDYASPLAYLDAFMCYVAEGGDAEKHPRGRIQTMALARYNQRILKNVVEEMESLRMMLERRLKQLYGDRVGSAEAEVLSILISGIYACRYYGTLTGAVNQSIVSELLNLS